MKTSFVLAAAAVMLAAASGSLYYYSIADSGSTHQAAPSPAPSEQNISAHPGGSGLELSAHTPTSDLDAVPAWVSRSGKGGAKDVAAPQPRPETRDASTKAKELQLAVNRLQSLQDQGAAAPSAVLSALDQLERANGSPVINGIPIDALRRNVKVAEQMQRIAADMQEIQSSTRTAQEKSALLNERLRQIEELRSRVTLDFSVARTRAEK